MVWIFRIDAIAGMIQPFETAAGFHNDARSAGIDEPPAKGFAQAVAIDEYERAARLGPGKPLGWFLVVPHLAKEPPGNRVHPGEQVSAFQIFFEFPVSKAPLELGTLDLADRGLGNPILL